MGKIKAFTVALVMILGSSFCFAKQISFQIVQHDISATEVTEQSLTIEDEVLTHFFDYGYIVTNSNAAISNSATDDEKLYNEGVGEAYEGFSDYFIQIRLFYGTANKTGDIPDLKKIDWTLASAKTGKEIKSHSFTDIKLEHKKDDMKNVSSALAAEINSALKAK